MRPSPPFGKSLTRDELADFARSGRLTALLDACDAPKVLDKIRELPEEQAVCLYINRAEEDFSAFAPYLFHVDVELLGWVWDTIAQDSGGLFVFSSIDPEALYKHFRRFLLVRDPSGEEIYFRYYDPRVLPKFLAACTEIERRDLFGPVLAFGIVQDDRINLLQEQSGPLPESAVPRPSRAGLFQIRADHMRAFQVEGEKAFEARLAGHIHAFHGEKVKGFPPENLDLLVRCGIARARRYGLASAADLTAFVAIMFEIGPNFDRHPYIQDVLTDRQTLPTQKMDALVKRVPKFVWEDAARRNDPIAWLDTAKEIA